MNTFLKKRSTRLGLCIASVLVGAYCVYGFIGLVRQTHTEAIAEDFGAAVKQLNNSPPGTQRVETFINQLKAIHTGYAPVEVKDALNAYISALQRSLDALKEGVDTKPYDKTIAEAKERLIACVRKCE